MKAQIHPQYFPEAKVVCSCGNTFTIGSTKGDIHVELCYNCHPFYTGQQKFVDTASRIQRFESKREKASTVVKAKEAKVQEEKQPQTLREMLEALKR